MKTPILSPLAVAGIQFYQRHLSPYKGFRCAFGAEGNVKSCSAFGMHVYTRYEVATASALLKRRFAACRAAYERLKDRAEERKRKRRETRKVIKESVADECACNGSEALGNAACDGIGSCSP